MNGKPLLQVVRHGEFVPCKTAFIDTHTPGSDQKENFTIIGGGVSESPDQHVHIVDTPGFNIGAAGQPPHCRNSLHSHRTAEVFIVLRGRWRFFWGRSGDAGDVVLEEGDIFNIPTGIFRGFQNVGSCHGMLLAILGGDDAGGGVTWAPQVIEDARNHGLILGDDGRLYDLTRDESLPDGVSPMPVLTSEQLADFPEPDAKTVVPRFVARCLDMRAMARGTPAQVIGLAGMLVDDPGFTVDFLTESTATEATSVPYSEVFMVTSGHWRLNAAAESAILAPGDICLVAPDCARHVKPATTGEAGLFRVTGNDTPAGTTRNGLASLPETGTRLQP